MNEQQNSIESDQSGSTINTKQSWNKKIWFLLCAVLLVILVFRIGYVFGERGYVFSATDFKVSKSSGSELNYGLLTKAVNIVKTKYIDRQNINDETVLYGAISGAVSAAGDEYTEFFDPKTLAEFRSELQGSFSGIGAEIGKRNGNVVIIAPLDDTPASKAGLQAQDIIVAVDGQSTVDMNVDQVVSKIRGPEGKEVTLTLFREGSTKPFDVKIVRQKIEVKSVKLTFKQANGKNVALLTISRFGDDTSKLFNAAVAEIKAKNPQGIILDLRNNPGGYLDIAVETSSDWLNKNDLVVKEEHSQKDITDFYSTGINRLGGYKTVVLLNGGSASASEIMAGALRDNKKALIVGEKSFGKGSVQELIPLGKDAAVKVTVAKWITPSGQHLNKDGIEPDIKVELKDEDINAKRDPQLDRALQEVIK